MRKFVLLLLAVSLSVSLFGVLWAEEEEQNIPVRTGADDYVKSMDLFRDNPGMKKHFSTRKKSSEKPSAKNSEQAKTSPSSEGWHPKAKYRVTEWIRLSDESYRLVIEARDGHKERPVEGKSDRGITLKKPIQFTVPDWVTQVHVDKKLNYEILDNGELRELDFGEGNGFRIAYPGDNVLLMNGDGLTTWVR